MYENKEFVHRDDKKDYHEREIFFLPPLIIQSVHYKTISTTYVVEPKILN